jgi:ribosome-associated protein
MAEAIVVRPGVIVPADAILVRAVRSSGPGGQNVNKVASKIELHVDLVKIVGLDYAARNRLWTACANRLDAEGHLLVVSQKTRDQPRNLADARERVREIVAAALERPRPRKPTRPTRGSIDRRIRAKKRLSGLKASRRDRGDDD